MTSPISSLCSHSLTDGNPSCSVCQAGQRTVLIPRSAIPPSLHAPVGLIAPSAGDPIPIDPQTLEPEAIVSLFSSLKESGKEELVATLSPGQVWRVFKLAPLEFFDENLSFFTAETHWRKLAKAMGKERAHGLLAILVPRLSISQLNLLYQRLSGSMIREATTLLRDKQKEAIRCSWRQGEGRSCHLWLTPLETAVHVNNAQNAENIAACFFQLSRQSQVAALACASPENLPSLITALKPTEFLPILDQLNLHQLEAVYLHLVQEEDQSLWVAALSSLSSEQLQWLIPRLDPKQVLTYSGLISTPVARKVLRCLTEQQKETLTAPFREVANILAAIPLVEQGNIPELVDVTLLALLSTDPETRVFYSQYWTLMPAEKLFRLVRLLGPEAMREFLPLLEKEGYFPLVLAGFCHERDPAIAFLKQELVPLNHLEGKSAAFFAHCQENLARANETLEAPPEKAALERICSMIQKASRRASKIAKALWDHVKVADFYMEASDFLMTKKLREQFAEAQERLKKQSNSLRRLMEQLTDPGFTASLARAKAQLEKTSDAPCAHTIPLSEQQAFDTESATRMYDSVRQALENLGGVPERLDKLDITYDDLLELKLYNQDDLKREGLTSLEKVARYIRQHQC